MRQDSHIHKMSKPLSLDCGNMIEDKGGGGGGEDSTAILDFWSFCYKGFMGRGLSRPENPGFHLFTTPPCLRIFFLRRLHASSPVTVDMKKTT